MHGQGEHAGPTRKGCGGGVRQGSGEGREGRGGGREAGKRAAAMAWGVHDRRKDIETRQVSESVISPRFRSL